MRSGTQWWENLCQLGLFRVGAKVRDGFLSLLTGSKANGRMKAGGHGPPNGVYKEAAFRFLLESESKRSERSGHLCQILLVYRTNAQGSIAPMDSDFAKTVISALSKNLRDTDYVGWYREGRVVGGVLTLVGRDAAVDGCTRLRTNLVKILQSELGPEKSHRVQVRICQPDEAQEVELL